MLGTIGHSPTFLFRIGNASHRVNSFPMDKAANREHLLGVISDLPIF